MSWEIRQECTGRLGLGNHREFRSVAQFSNVAGSCNYFPLFCLVVLSFLDNTDVHAVLLQAKSGKRCIRKGIQNYAFRIFGDCYFLYFNYLPAHRPIDNRAGSVSEPYFFPFLIADIALHASFGTLSKSLNCPAPFNHSPPSIVTTSPFMYPA